jgi:Rap1a immunity proteins
MVHLFAPALVAGMVMLANGNAGSDQLSAGELYGFCKDEAFAPSQAACKFYILGITQGMGVRMNDQGAFVESGSLCVPPDMTSEEMKLVFIRVAKNDFALFPEDKQLLASGLVGGIMARQFPCQKRPQSKDSP